MQRVDEDTERVVVTLNRNTVPPSSALYLRSLLSETFAAKAAATPTDSPSPGEDTGAEAVQVRPWGRLEFGATTNAVVVALKEYGVVLKAVASTGKSKNKKAAADKGGQLMVCPPEHAMDGVEEGNEVKVSWATKGFAVLCGVLCVQSRVQLCNFAVSSSCGVVWGVVCSKPSVTLLLVFPTNMIRLYMCDIIWYIAG